jgi:DnaJ-class molecular chaperone
MKALLEILVLLFALYGGFRLYQDLTAEPEPARPEPAPRIVIQQQPSAPTARAPAAPSTRRVACKTCKETGRLIDHSGSIQTSYSCPICRGAGEHILSERGKLCHHCRGMGRVVRDSSVRGRLLAQECPLCDGAGVLSGS